MLQELKETVDKELKDHRGTLYEQRGNVNKGIITGNQTNSGAEN